MGAAVFTCPNQYAWVLETLEQRHDVELHASSVIIAQSFIPDLEACLSSVPSAQKVRVKRSMELGTAPLLHGRAEPPSLSEDVLAEWADDSHVIDVENTFLCLVPKGRWRSETSVNQSTTEAHESIGNVSRPRNPRRYGGANPRPMSPERAGEQDSEFLPVLRIKRLSHE